MPWINEFLDKAGIPARELDLIVCAIGPGSFTGLRIGLATAKGLAFGGDCALAGIPSLDSYGYALKYHTGPVVPVFDAKKHRYYTAIYLQGNRQTEPLDLGAEEILSRLEGYESVLFTGQAAPELEKFCLNRGTSFTFDTDPQGYCAYPGSLLKLGLEKFKQKGGDPLSLSPLYLRKSEAELNRRN